MENTKTHLELARTLLLFSRGINPDQERQSRKSLSLKELSSFDGVTYDQEGIYFNIQKDNCICPVHCNEKALTVHIYNDDQESLCDLCLLLKFESSGGFKLEITPAGADFLDQETPVKVLEILFEAINAISSATKISPQALMVGHPKLRKAFKPLLVRAYAPWLYPAFFEYKGK